MFRILVTMRLSVILNLEPLLFLLGIIQEIISGPELYSCVPDWHISVLFTKLIS